MRTLLAILFVTLCMSQTSPLLAQPLPKNALTGDEVRLRQSGRFRPGPKVQRYDYAKDEVIHRPSIFYPERELPGGDVAYTGSRLTRWTWIGLPGAGGYYEDILRDQQKRNLDPRKYRYRN